MRGLAISVAVVLLALASVAGAATLLADEPDGESSGKEYSNTLRWRTASEVDNFGFDVYRAEAEDGPFERITDNPVPGAGTSDEPSRYEYVDRAIDPERDYYYYVESISMSGERRKFTPTIRAEAKVAPGDEQDDGGG